jgi:hypothetical protein
MHSAVILASGTVSPQKNGPVGGLPGLIGVAGKLSKLIEASNAKDNLTL